MAGSRALKVFVSQPMANRGDAEIEAEREKIMMLCAEKLGNVREIASYSSLRHRKNALHELGRSIQLMSGADVVVFAPGWQYARGCKVERMCAEKYGLDIIDAGPWVFDKEGEKDDEDKQ